MTDTPTVDAERTGAWRALPVWARIGILALLAVVLALVAIVLIRLATRVPAIPLGTTASAELRPGACLAEAGPGLAEYTVVGCGQGHAQQVFATADLELEQNVYGLIDSSLSMFGDEVCRHYLEYRIFLVEDLDKSEYVAYAIDVPTAEAYTAGDTEALCAIAAMDGAPLTGDLYRAMP